MGLAQVIGLASSQKRDILKRNGEGRKFEVNMEEKRIEEMEGIQKTFGTKRNFTDNTLPQREEK